MTIWQLVILKLGGFDYISQTLKSTRRKASYKVKRWNLSSDLLVENPHKRNVQTLRLF